MPADVIVVGLGGMGSAAAAELAGRGHRVRGFDRYPPVHRHGSSHGGSRIIRQAYFEDPAYVPLLLRAYELWDRVERDSGEHMRHPTGGLMVGRPDSATVAGSIRSAQEWALPHEVLDAAEIRRRFPVMRPDADEIGCYESAGGFVSPEASVGAQLRLAERAGAELHHEEPVTTWSSDANGVSVTTGRGTHSAERLVICPGPWAPELLSDLGVAFRVERQVQFWFAPRGAADAFGVGRFPIFIWELPGGRQFYGMPAHRVDEVKVAFVRGGPTCTPDTIDRTVRPAEIEDIADLLRERIPNMSGTFLRASTCMYTNTADEHFVIANHPLRQNVVVACGFSGHGFKFVPVVAEILADLAIEGSTRHPIGLFDPARLQLPHRPGESRGAAEDPRD